MSINSKSCRSDAAVRTRIGARLAQIQTRAEQATDGPWSRFETVMADTFVVGPRGFIREDIVSGPTYERENAEFIAHARTDVPALTNAVESVLDYVGRCEESGTTMQPGDIRRLIAAALGVTA